MLFDFISIVFLNVHNGFIDLKCNSGESVCGRFLFFNDGVYIHKNLVDGRIEGEHVEIHLLDFHIEREPVQRDLRQLDFQNRMNLRVKNLLSKNLKTIDL